MNRILLLGVPALAAAYAYWVSGPKVHDSHSQELFLEEAREHFLNCKNLAADRCANGYTAQLFSDYWERSKSTAKESLSRTVVDCLACASVTYDDEDEPEDVEKIESARQDFRSYLPELHREMRKPVFLHPKIGFGTSDLALDMLPLKQLARAMCGEAETLALEGREEEALECFRSVLAASRGYRSFALLIRLLIAFGLIDVASRTIMHIHSPDDANAPWSDYSTLILGALPSRSELVLCLKCEFAFGQRIFEDVRAGELPAEHTVEFGEKLPLWKKLPGQLGRAKRIYQRDFVEFLTRVENGEHTDDLKNEVSQKFQRYLRTLEVWIAFFRTFAIVCAHLGKRYSGNLRPNDGSDFEGLPSEAVYRDGQVSFDPGEPDLRLENLSSRWVESKAGRVTFTLTALDTTRY